MEHMFLNQLFCWENMTKRVFVVAFLYEMYCMCSVFSSFSSYLFFVFFWDPHTHEIYFLWGSLLCFDGFKKKIKTWNRQVITHLRKQYDYDSTIYIGCIAPVCEGLSLFLNYDHNIIEHSLKVHDTCEQLLITVARWLHYSYMVLSFVMDLLDFHIGIHF